MELCNSAQLANCIPWSIMSNRTKKPLQLCNLPLHTLHPLPLPQTHKCARIHTHTLACARSHLAEHLVHEVDIAASGQQDALDHVVNLTMLLLNAAQAATAEPALGQRAPIRAASVLLHRPASVWLRRPLRHCSASPDGLQERAPLLSDPPRHRARLKTHLVFGELRGWCAHFPQN